MKLSIDSEMFYKNLTERRMKSPFLTILIFSGILTLSVLIVELLYASSFSTKLNSGETGQAKNSYTDKIAREDQNYNKLEHMAVSKKLSRVQNELLSWICMLCVPILFFNKKLKESIINLADIKITILKKDSFDILTKEVNYICLIGILLILLSTSGTILEFSLLENIIGQLIFYLLIFCIVLPSLVILVYSMFRIYGKKFIYACYLAYFLKIISEFMSFDGVNEAEFELLSDDNFSKDVQNFLKEQELLGKVYVERKKGKSVNAALVGWGKGEHIEIYGKHSDYSSKEFEAVLMHEIGHSKDFSLYKKVAVLVTLKIVEMIIIISIYTHCSSDYEDENISKTGAFMILYIFYEIFLYRYLMMFHKLTSHIAETSADIIGKNHGYGEPLSKVLYKITTESAEFLNPTFMYNALRSFHPSVAARIEYLNEPIN